MATWRRGDVIAEGQFSRRQESKLVLSVHHYVSADIYVIGVNSHGQTVVSVSHASLCIDLTCRHHPRIGSNRDEQ